MSLHVSVITPTYNRISQIRNAIKFYRNQTYPHELMEWIILDDGTDVAEAVIMDEAFDLPNIRYIRSYQKQTIGAKRNRLNLEARAPIIVSWDDDDFYPPERISHIVAQFKLNPTLNVAGSSLMYFYFNDDNKYLYIALISACRGISIFIFVCDIRWFKTPRCFTSNH